MGQHSAPEVASQVRYPWRTLARTTFQLIVGLAAAMPLIVSSSGLPSTAAGVGAALAISAAITRFMSVPQVNIALATWVPWLAAEPRDNGAPADRDHTITAAFVDYYGNPAEAAAALERAKRREQERQRMWRRE
ncbi:hypothetical protein [Nocardia sp. NPDC059236]|uniref:hypothetical protein n=1 Tax=Nocardia sp. NPDC059236 TaxID=3346783 RepID=UPI003693C2C5